MTTVTPTTSRAAEATPSLPKTKGEKYESLAFTFCKAATLILLTGRLALPVAAGAAAVFYVLAFRNNKRDTRCVGQAPLVIAAFWSVVCVVSLLRLLGLLRPPFLP